MIGNNTSALIQKAVIMQVVHNDVDVSVTASIYMLMFSRFFTEYKGLDHTTRGHVGCYLY